jgi:hypothetical protein
LLFLDLSLIMNLPEKSHYVEEVPNIFCNLSYGYYSHALDMQIFCYSTLLGIIFVEWCSVYVNDLHTITCSGVLDQRGHCPEKHSARLLKLCLASSCATSLASLLHCSNLISLTLVARSSQSSKIVANKVTEKPHFFFVSIT